MEGAGERYRALLVVGFAGLAFAEETAENAALLLLLLAVASRGGYGGGEHQLGGDREAGTWLISGHFPLV